MASPAHRDPPFTQGAPRTGEAPPRPRRPAGPPGAMTLEQKKVIFASSLGTVFEWYDFYLFGSMAALLARHFFGGLGSQSAFAFALLAFAAGFVVRPFGALVFGRLGDLIGRKYTFIVTILVMGLATFAVGVLPTYEAIGLAAPIILVVLRMAQGLALGGEYGGAAVYVAEHASHGQRGLATAWIQTTATLGFFLSLVVVLITRLALGETAFDEWGWRLPFLGSAVLLAIGVWIRLSLGESPVFRQMKSNGRTSRMPLVESFAEWPNLRLVLVALFGIVAGQAVIWYASQFYALFFLTEVLRVAVWDATLAMAVALALGTPFFLVFGALSDRIGRKPVILTGFVLAAAGLFPVFQAMTAVAHPTLAAARQAAPIVVFADPATCSLQGNPLAREADHTSGCDIARRELARMGLAYETVERAGSGASVRVGAVELAVPDATREPARHRLDEASRLRIAQFDEALERAVADAGYPGEAPPLPIGSVRWWQLVGLLFALVLMVTLVYGPLAAALSEMFPTRIRYTSMSLPYHLGNGWFGGLMPSIAFALVAATGNPYQGLVYPVAVVAFSALVCLLAVPETRDRRLSDDR